MSAATLILVGAAASAGAAFGCECLVNHTVPVQGARHIQEETYYHTYDVPDEDTATRVFGELLGAKNICALSCDSWTKYLKAAVEGRFEVTGQISLSLSVYPLDRSKIFIEGIGNYLVRNKDTRELIASANFHIVDDGPRAVGHGNHAIELRVRQVIARQFEENFKSYAHLSELVARVYIKELHPDGVLEVADGEHELGLRIHPALPRHEDSGTEAAGAKQQDPSKDLEIDYPSEIEVWPVGCLTFINRGDGRKLIDLRRMTKLVRDDYETILDGSAAAPSPQGAQPTKFVWRRRPTCRRDGDKYRGLGGVQVTATALSTRLPPIGCKKCDGTAPADSAGTVSTGKPEAKPPER